MKKNLLCLLTLIFAMSLFTSCKEDKPEILPVEQIEGTYKGALVVDVMEGTMMQNVIITKTGDNTIKLELKNFKPLNIGDISIENCAVTKSGDVYNFTGEKTLDLTDKNLGKCPVKIVKGEISGEKLSLILKVDTTVPVTLTVNVDFNGTKLKGNESSEAKILSFTFDSNIVTEQPKIDEVAGKITFKVDESATNEQLFLTPTITISDKATISPSAEVKSNFSNNNVVVYTVTAENGTSKDYSVSVSGTNKVVYYDFESWTVDKSQSTPEYQYAILEGGWASCNMAVVFIKGFGSLAVPPISYTGGFPIDKTEDAHSGKYAALLESIDTKGSDNMLGQKVPKVTAGSLFLGTFNAMAALEDPMATTSFGVMYDKKPLLVKGFFKYSAGKEFYNSKGQLEADKKDECAISAVLYEVANEKETLDGNTIFNSEKIVASAMFTNAGTSAYSPFTLEMNYVKAYDPAKKYKLAVIFSASKDGAAYNAAVGSKLYVDDVTIINE